LVAGLVAALALRISEKTVQSSWGFALDLQALNTKDEIDVKYGLCYTSYRKITGF